MSCAPGPTELAERGDAIQILRVDDKAYATALLQRAGVPAPSPSSPAASDAAKPRPRRNRRHDRRRVTSRQLPALRAVVEAARWLRRA